MPRQSNISMAPKRQRQAAPKKASSAQAAPAPDIRELLKRCSRSSLESLLVSKFDGGFLSVEEVEAQLVPTAPPSRAMLSGTERVGTGAFDELDCDVFTAIVTELDLRDRLQVATCVCKGWRFLKDVSHLWTSMRVAGSSSESSWRDRGSHDRVTVSNSGLTRLLDWVGAASLTELRLHTGDAALQPWTVTSTLSAVPAIKVLHLGGKKVNAAVMEATAKAAFAPTLREIHIGEDVAGSEARILSMLQEMPALESLSVPRGRVSAPMLRTLAAAWRTKRNGGPPLLSKLTLATSWGQFEWELVCCVGSLFPELEELTVDSLSVGLDVPLSSNEDNAAWRDYQAQPKVRGAVDAMPRLVRLRLQRFCGYDFYACSSEVAACLRAVLRAAPALETLLVLGGELTSTRNRADKTLPRPTDAAGASLELLPPSLQELVLSDLDLAPDDFGIAPSLPALRRLQLGNCGARAANVAAALVRECPKLKDAVVESAPVKRRGAD